MLVYHTQGPVLSPQDHLEKAFQTCASPPQKSYRHTPHIRGFKQADARFFKLLCIFVDFLKFLIFWKLKFMPKFSFDAVTDSLPLRGALPALSSVTFCSRLPLPVLPWAVLLFRFPPFLLPQKFPLLMHLVFTIFVLNPLMVSLKCLLAFKTVLLLLFQVQRIESRQTLHQKTSAPVQGSFPLSFGRT